MVISKIIRTQFFRFVNNITKAKLDLECGPKSRLHHVCYFPETNSCVDVG